MGVVTSLIAPAAMLSVLALLRLALLRPLVGFGLFMALWAIGGFVSLGLALRAWRVGESATALGHLAIGLLLIGGLLAAAAGSRAPAIHDLTTDPDDAPEFRQAAHLPANQGRDMSYPDGGAEVPAIQAEAYPELRPIRLEAAPDEALAAARRAATALGWEVTWSNVQLGVMEAYATSTLFRFVDDVAVRVRPDGDGSRVDVRSTSRVGRSDLGANAARIERFAVELRRQIAGG